MNFNDFINSIFSNRYKDILIDLIYIAKKAKDEVLKYYNKGFDVEIKFDNSPVTSADLASNNLICSFLKEKHPTYAILSEESADDLNRLDNDKLFIIDPIDGTADFVDKDDEFAINIAFSENKKISIGVIVIPALNYIYFSAIGLKSYKYDLTNDTVKVINVSNKKDNLIMLTSRKHGGSLEPIEHIKSKITEIKKCGSSYKACLVSQGDADLYFNNSQNTKEWDVAPIDIIVKNAGGTFLTLNSLKEFEYNKKDPYNREGFLCINNLENFKN